MQSYQQHIMHETGQKRTTPAFSKTRKKKQVDIFPEEKPNS